MSIYYFLTDAHGKKLSSTAFRKSISSLFSQFGDKNDYASKLLIQLYANRPIGRINLDTNAIDYITLSPEEIKQYSSGARSPEIDFKRWTQTARGLVGDVVREYDINYHEKSISYETFQRSKVKYSSKVYIEVMFEGSFAYIDNVSGRKTKSTQLEWKNG